MLTKVHYSMMKIRLNSVWETYRLANPIIAGIGKKTRNTEDSTPEYLPF